MLFGLPIVTGRAIGLERLDPALARELFIRHALVQGEWESPHPFLVANRVFVESLRDLGERVRRVDLADDAVVFAFYDRALPATATNAREFDKWWKGARATDPEALTLSVEKLSALRGEAETVLDPRDFPGTWRQDDLELEVTYRFDPGVPDDGVLVHVPLAVLNVFAWTASTGRSGACARSSSGRWSSRCRRSTDANCTRSRRSLPTRGGTCLPCRRLLFGGRARAGAHRRHPGDRAALSSTCRRCRRTCACRSPSRTSVANAWRSARTSTSCARCSTPVRLAVAGDADRRAARHHVVDWATCLARSSRPPTATWCVVTRRWSTTATRCRFACRPTRICSRR